MNEQHIVSAFDRDRVLSFFERWYTAEHLCVVAVGDCDAGDLMQAVRERFGSARGGSARRARRPGGRSPRPADGARRSRSCDLR